MIAGFAAGEVDKLAETKGEDWVREHRMRERTQEQAESLYDQHYGGDDNYNPYVVFLLLFVRGVYGANFSRVCRQQRDAPQHFDNYNNNW